MIELTQQEQDALELAKIWVDLNRDAVDLDAYPDSLRFARALLSLHGKLEESETRLDAQFTDSMIAHCWFSEMIGESVNGRDFSIKIPMAREWVKGLRAELTEARKAVSESDALRSAAYSEREEALKQLEIARKAPCAPECASFVSKRPHVGGKLTPMACNCWKSQITPTETP